MSGCSNAAKLTEYDFGTDKIPTVNAVIGEERKVSGIGTGISNGVRYKTYTYETDTTADDLWTYYSRLEELGWGVLESFDLSDDKGLMKLAIESADEGNILVMSIDFDQYYYTISIEKGAGELTQ